MHLGALLGRLPRSDRPIEREAHGIERHSDDLPAYAVDHRFDDTAKHQLPELSIADQRLRAVANIDVGVAGRAGVDPCNVVRLHHRPLAERGTVGVSELGCLRIAVARRTAEAARGAVRTAPILLAADGLFLEH